MKNQLAGDLTRSKDAVMLFHMFNELAHQLKSASDRLERRTDDEDDEDIGSLAVAVAGLSDLAGLSVSALHSACLAITAANSKRYPDRSKRLVEATEIADRMINKLTNETGPILLGYAKTLDFGRP